MNSNHSRKAAFFVLTLAMCALFLGTTDLPVAAEPTLHTVNGQITGLQGMVITLDKKGAYYPVSDLHLPAWVKVGEKASLLYAGKGSKSYYYEVVQPGKKFTILEDGTTAEKEKR